MLKIRKKSIHQIKFDLNLNGKKNEMKNYFYKNLHLTGCIGYFWAITGSLCRV